MYRRPIRQAGGKRRTISFMAFAMVLVLAAFLPAVAPAGVAEASTSVGGPINSDTTWTTAGSPYIVTSGVLIAPDVTLTIEPGVTVKFEANKALAVEGELVARGTEAQPVVFTANDTYEPGQWGNIWFKETSARAVYDDDGGYVSGSVLQHCVVEYGGGVTIEAVKIEGSAPFLDRVTIRHSDGRGVTADDAKECRIANSTISDNNGSGIHQHYGTLTIEGSIISDNNGSGIHQHYGTLTIEGSTISDNNGSGIYHYYGTLTIEGSAISGNSASSGGGIYHYYGTLTIEGSAISGNSASSGGGVYQNRGTLTINDSTISDNSASNRGGGIYQTWSTSTLSVNDSTLSGNSASNGGGGIYQDNGTLTINECTISDNSASLGGGIYLSSTTVSMGGSTISRNSGSGIYISGGTPECNDNNIHDNTPYDAYNNRPVDLDFTENWWGTTDQAAIDSQIYDWYDDASLGRVNYTPFLTTRVNRSPAQPSNVAPDDAATGVALTPTLQSSSFSDPDEGDMHAASEWQITTTPDDYSSPVYDSGTDTSNLIQIDIPSGILEFDTTHYWRVRHQDIIGAFSDWSAETSFTTVSGLPENLTRTTPDNDNTPTFTWDAVADVASYEVRIDSDDYLDIGHVISYTVPGVLINGSYTFYVRAKDNVGNTGEAASLDFIIDVTPPAVPENPIRTTPDNDNVPAFIWDAVADAASYEVRIDWDDYHDIGDATSYTVPSALSDGSYTFYIRAKDDAGNTGESAILGFIIDVTPPAVPENLARTTPNNDNMPAFTWDAATDDIFGVASYEVRIGSDDYQDIGDVTSYTVPSVLINDNYTFYVRAKDNAGNTGEAASLDFMIDVPPPAAPENLVRTTPDNDNMPAFTWDAVAGAAAYEVRIGSDDYQNIGDVTSYTAPSVLINGSYAFYVRAKDNAGNTGEAASVDFIIDVMPPDMPENPARTTPDNDNMPAFTWDAVTGAVSYEMKLDSDDYQDIGDVISYTVPGALINGSYTFYIRAKDNAGNTGEAVSLDFMIDVPLPGAPEDLARTTPDNDNMPAFTWDAVTGAAAYEVRIDSDDYQDIGDVTSYTVPGALINGSYTFYVRAKDNAGNTGEAVSLGFMIDVPLPATPENLARTTPDNDNMPAFTWHAVAGAAAYEVRIDSDDYQDTGDLTDYAVPSALADGAYTFYVRAIDNAGNTGEAASLSFVIDTTSLASPANLTRTTPDTDPSPTFTWDAVPGAVSYEVKIGSHLYNDIGNATSYTVTVPYDGSYTFYVRAKDDAGNPGTEARLNFTIDTTPVAAGPEHGKSDIDQIMEWARDNWLIPAGAAAGFLFLMVAAIFIPLRVRRYKEAQGWKDEGYWW